MRAHDIPVRADLSHSACHQEVVPTSKGQDVAAHRVLWQQDGASNGRKLQRDGK